MNNCDISILIADGEYFLCPLECTKSLGGTAAGQRGSIHSSTGCLDCKWCLSYTFSQAKEALPHHSLCHRWALSSHSMNSWLAITLLYCYPVTHICNFLPFHETKNICYRHHNNKQPCKMRQVIQQLAFTCHHSKDCFLIPWLQCMWQCL